MWEFKVKDLIRLISFYTVYGIERTAYNVQKKAFSVESRVHAVEKSNAQYTVYLYNSQVV
jgi:hypothetical protein